MRWCALSEIGQRAGTDAQAVHYAVQQEWVELSPGLTRTRSC
jgi:hypothetical protein